MCVVSGLAARRLITVYGVLSTVYSVLSAECGTSLPRPVLSLGHTPFP